MNPKSETMLVGGALAPLTKHLGRYVGDFAGRHGIRGLDTLDMMGYLAGGMRGKRLTYRTLIADNGLPSGARPY